MTKMSVRCVSRC